MPPADSGVRRRHVGLGEYLAANSADEGGKQQNVDVDSKAILQ
jgi:hypothetical protein